MSRFSLLVLVFLLAALAGCNRDTAPEAITAPASSKGWEVRYNATLALANRGSDHIKDQEVWENLLEMLDENQQLANFNKVPTPDGKEAPDPASARMTVIGALQAIEELHRRRPDMDLSGLNPTIEKLIKSSNVAVRTEATKTKLLLEKK